VTAARRVLDARLRAAIRDVPDFPKPGILFKDITPVLSDPGLFHDVSDALAAAFAGAGVTHVAAVESRGFIFGAPVADRLGAGFVPIRKKGKLPSRTEREEYALEYGTDVLEVHADGAGQGSRVLVVDDVLATGGTAAAACRLIERLGADVAGCGFVIALGFLGGSKQLEGRRVETLVTF
jgi:adenine phosphoribosyltransferase